MFSIFFKIELDVLKSLLSKNLILDFIQEFTNRAKILILFIFKKRIIAYSVPIVEKLNALIINNKYAFSLIDETLNCFINVADFIKLDFKIYIIKINHIK